LEDLNLLPIFHDDQHGTAIVTLAGLINACKLTSRKIESTKCVINGAGAAGLTIAKLLLSYGFKDIVVCDSTGTIYKGREENMNNFKHLIA
jgi:malate dehydrogenase (oxaloacetate-decarboxylating)